ncbi:hypothetical protein NBRC116601_21180 [Cognatishimia sp. WU-CL00825]|uniref:VOC family protein n=1 Tax=Cognatishimia sp. WU-CL00825 TaxID=3127658 RepID=UPI00310ADA32
MHSPFVWFDNIGPARAKTTDFLKDMFDLSDAPTDAMTFLTNPDQQMPFAATCDAMLEVSGWVPYVEVDDLQAAVAKAQAAGAQIVVEDMEGPAGRASFVRDPGGAVLALWKRGGAN